MSKKSKAIIKRTLVVLGTALLSLTGIATYLGYSISKEVPLGNIERNQIKRYEKATNYGDNIEYVTQESYLKNKLSQSEASMLFNTYGRGTLYVEDINTTMPIYEGSDQNTLLYGAGTANQGQKMGIGNFTVLGHNMFNGTIFTYLSNVNIGTKAYMTDFKYTYTYKIKSKDSIHESEGIVMNDPLLPVEEEESKILEERLRKDDDFRIEYLLKTPSEAIKSDLGYSPTLTMITCNGNVGTTQRWLVVAELESVSENKEIPKDVSTSLAVPTETKDEEENSRSKTEEVSIKTNNKLNDMNIFQKFIYYLTTGLRVLGLIK